MFKHIAILDRLIVKVLFFQFEQNFSSAFILSVSISLVNYFLYVDLNQVTSGQGDTPFCNQRNIQDPICDSSNFFNCYLSVNQKSYWLIILSWSLDYFNKFSSKKLCYCPKMPQMGLLESRLTFTSSPLNSKKF